MNKRIKHSAVKIYSLVENIIQRDKDDNNRNLYQTAGKGVGVVFLVKLEGQPTLFLLTRPTLFYFIKFRGKKSHFCLALNGVLGERVEEDFNQKSKQDNREAQITARNDSNKKGQRV